MRGQLRVVVDAPAGLRIGIHQRGGQPRQFMQQAVLGVNGDPVCLNRPDLALGTQIMPDPPQPDRNAQYPWRRLQNPLALVHQGGVHRALQAPALGLARWRYLTHVQDHSTMAATDRLALRDTKIRGTSPSG